MGWLLRQYRKRIVNVNVNIIAAGIIAIGFTNAVMYLLQVVGVLDKLKHILPDWHFALLGKERSIHGQYVLISGLTLVVDLAMDVAAYYVLHWLANHMPRASQGCALKSAVYANMTFMQDASLVQFQRALLSPILYIVAIGLQNRLLHAGESVTYATTIGYGTGIIMCRFLHTIWMLRYEKRAEERLKTAAASTTPPAPGASTNA